ncbi:unnamed protein product [Cylindrotheca closterium]|uniref:ADP,ATP carrier protein n=1 Tax=Cylindrotheca closterium TaxID=2856 RepID=A0AAD2JPB9_9STRA|nr:unnamed protein product [Cylindrotheca closterium]
MRIRSCISQRRILLILLSFCVLLSSQRSCLSLVKAVEIDSKHVEPKENNDDNDTTTTTSSLRSRPTPSSTLKEEIPTKRQIAAGGILRKAFLRGLNGGISGLIAGCIQVITLMWLRTVINYQCRYGTTFRHAIDLLYREGGVGRLYEGVGFALIQAPMSKFFATAANDGMQAILACFDISRSWGIGTQTFLASIVVGCFRMVLMPIDTCKVVLQVDGKQGFRGLLLRVKAGNFGVLYQGAIINSISSAMSNFPWFFIYNLLSKNQVVMSLVQSPLVRNGLVGFCASLVSDTIVNPLRVIKTTKQSMGSKHEGITYGDTVRMIFTADGWKGFFIRGLRTRMIANAIQSALFTIIWRKLADEWGNRAENVEQSSTIGAK